MAALRLAGESQVLEYAGKKLSRILTAEGILQETASLANNNVHSVWARIKASFPTLPPS